MNIEELLPYLEKRPQMYFREKNVFFLEAFLGVFFKINLLQMILDVIFIIGCKKKLIWKII